MFFGKVKNFIVRYKILFFLIFIFSPFRVYHLTNPLLEATNFRQSQTATVALNFFRSGINLFRTELDIFGIGKERYLLLEFPLYQAVVALLYKIFFFSEIWGRIVSIVAGYLGAWYLYKLVCLVFHQKKIAFFSAFFFLSVPLNMFYQRSFMIEPTVIAFLLAGLFYFCHWINYLEKRSYFLSIIFLSLAFLQKGIYGLFWFLPMIVYSIKKRPIRHIFKINFLFVFLFPLIFLFLWQRYEDNLNILNGHEYFASNNKRLQEWFFGRLEDRFNLSMWEVRKKQILDGIFLKPGLILFLFGLVKIFRTSYGYFFYSWLFSQLLYFLTLFRIQSHNYYQMIMVPVIAVFIAAGLVNLVDFLVNTINFLLRKIKKELKKFSQFKEKKFFILDSLVTSRYFEISLFTLFLTIFIWRSWLHARWSFVVDWEEYKNLIMVGKLLPKEVYGILVTSGYDWNSAYTYYPKRKMLLIEPENISRENIKKWQKEGYSFIFFHDYKKYPEYFKEKGIVYPSWDFLEDFQEITSLENAKVYLFK